MIGKIQFRCLASLQKTVRRPRLAVNTERFPASRTRNPGSRRTRAGICWIIYLFVKALYLHQRSDRPQVEASVAEAVAVDSVLVCVQAGRHVGRSQQELLQLVRKRGRGRSVTWQPDGETAYHWFLFLSKKINKNRIVFLLFST